MRAVRIGDGTGYRAGDVAQGVLAGGDLISGVVLRVIGEDGVVMRVVAQVHERMGGEVAQLRGGEGAVDVAERFEGAGAEAGEEVGFDLLGRQGFEGDALAVDLRERGAAIEALTVEDVPPEGFVVQDVGGGDEKGGGDAVLFEDGQGEGVVEVAVVEREQGVLAGGIEGAAVENVARGNEAVAVGEVVGDELVEVADGGALQGVDLIEGDLAAIAEEGVEEEADQAGALGAEGEGDAGDRVVGGTDETLDGGGEQSLSCFQARRRQRRKGSVRRAKAGIGSDHSK